MKNIQKLKAALLLLLLGFLFSFIDSSSLTIIAEVSTNSPFEYPTLQAYTPHGPIYIDYDDNFTDYGFPGTGSPGDPYRIEDYNITISGDYPILFSGNNTKHFVIQNCLLRSDTNIGIYLGKYYEMGEGTVNILNNIIISENSNGIEVYGGNYTEITGNTIIAWDCGLLIEYGVYSFISENIINSNNNAGISLGFCPNSTIIRNNCTGGSHGIEAFKCSDSSLTYNNCSYNNYGIYLDEVSEATISNNIITDNIFDGIDTNFCDDTVFTNNLLQENGEYGIVFGLSSGGNTIHHNAFISNNPGGTSQAGDDGALNFWYDATINEGNYWAWLNGTVVTGTYSIDGMASSIDPYPLGSMPVIPEYSNAYFAIFLMLFLITIPIVYFNKRKKN